MISLSALTQQYVQSVIEISESESPCIIRDEIVSSFSYTLHLKPRSQVTLVFMTQESTALVQRSIHIIVEEDARAYVEFFCSQALQTCQITLDLVGRGAHAHVQGGWIINKESSLHCRTFQNHYAPYTTSSLLVKGIVAQRASSTYEGMVCVSKEAQETNAAQYHKAIVWDEHAHARAIPSMEVVTDAVRCAHGSAVGPLDETMSLYLASRGIDRVQARRLLAQAFFKDHYANFLLQNKILKYIETL